jgi:glutamine synthetase
MPNPSSAATIIAAVRNRPGNRVKVAVSDIDGVLRGKYLHKDKFYSAAEGGFGFCDVVFGWDMMDVTYDNTTLTGWHKGFPDVLAKIDLGTYRTCPGTAACRSSSATSSARKAARKCRCRSARGRC